MIGVLLSLALGASSDSLDCHRYLVPLSAAERQADSTLISRAIGGQTTSLPLKPVRVDGVMALEGWRVIWAEPTDMEPGVFFFRKSGDDIRYVDVWGGVTGDALGASRWASKKIGAPVALARCFANRLVADGP